MTDVTRDLISLSEHAYARTRHRLDGLTDDEYFWEPVVGCWTLRPDDTGELIADPRAVDQVSASPPFTTIAWRVWHLIGCYGSERNTRWLGLDRRVGGFEAGDPAPADAVAALDALDRAHASWRDLLGGLPVDRWSEPLGAVAGGFGEATKRSFVLHQLDEQIHHGAELGVLRDLYAARMS